MRDDEEIGVRREADERRRGLRPRGRRDATSGRRDEASLGGLLEIDAVQTVSDRRGEPGPGRIRGERARVLQADFAGLEGQLGDAPAVLAKEERMILASDTTIR